MIQQYILTVEKYGELDTYGDLDVAFNYVFDDPENISERRSSFSKTIFLPNTNQNAEFFKNYFGLTIEDSFDTRKKVKCDVRMGSDNVFPGFLKLKSVVNKFEDISYEVNIISHDIALSDDIGDDSFNELDFSEFNHIRNKENIINSWAVSIKQNNIDIPFKIGNGYVYPDIIYGNDQDIYNRRKVYDLFPAIYDYTIIQKIMQRYGRTIVSDFFETEYFKSLIIPFSKDKLSIDDEEKSKRELFVGIPSASSPLDLGIEMERDPSASQDFKNTLQNPINVFQFTDESTLDFNDPGNNFYGSYWMPSKQGRYNISFQGRLLMEYRSFNGNDFEYDSGTLNYYYRMYLRRTDGSEIIISDSGVTLANPFGMLDFAPSDNASHTSPWLDTAQQLVMTMNASDVFMNPGDKVYVQMFFKHPGDTDWNIDSSLSKKVTAKPVLLRDTAGELSFFKVELNNNIMMANELVNMNSILPEMKIKDYLNNLIKEFNLVFVADKEDPYLIRVEPLVNYLKSRERIIDLSDRLDHDQSIIKTPTTDLVARNFKFSHTEDSDYFNENYQDETNKIYGQQTIFTNNEINNTDDITKLSWAATPSAQRYFIDRITPWFCTIDADETLKPKSVKPRHLFYNGLKSCNFWIMEDYKDDPTFYPSFLYPQCGMWDDMQNPTTSLEFGPSDKIYFNSSTFPGMNLFNLFHRDYLQSIVDKDAYILKAYFYLDPAIIADLDYRDIIHIDGVNYRVLKINNYNPIAYDKTTEVELLKIVDYETYFTEYTNVPLAHFYCPSDVQLIKDSNTFIYKSKSGQEISEMCCDSLGGEFINGVCKMRTIGANPEGPILLDNISTESQDASNGTTNTIASPSITATGNNIYTAPGSNNLNILGDNISANSSASNAMAIGSNITMSGGNMLVVGNNINAVGPGLWTDSINGIPAASFTSPDLATVLTNGNTTGTNDIIIDTTQVIKSSNGNSQIDLDYGGSPGFLVISNDNGGLSNDWIGLNPGVGIGIASQLSIGINGNGSIINLNSSAAQITVGNSGLFIFNNVSGGGTGVLSSNSSSLSSSSSVVNPGVLNSVILGGVGITASASNTIYMANVNLAYTPATNNSNRLLLTRNATTGDVELRDVSTIVGGGISKYAATINLSAGNNVITHSLGNTDITVNLYDSTGFQVIPDEVYGATATQVTIRISTAMSSARVIVIG